MRNSTHLTSFLQLLYISEDVILTIKDVIGSDQLLLFKIILYVHILSAVVSIGPLFSLLIIVKLMKSAQNSALEGYVRSFQAGITAVKHAGHVVVPTGIVLIWLGGWPWYTSWVVLTVVLMVGSIFFLASAFKPAMKTFGTEHFVKAEFITKLRRATWLYIFILLIMLWLMVNKPVFW